MTPIVAIQVDHAQDDYMSPTSPSQWNRWSTSYLPPIISSTAPSQHLDLYRLASVISPLLSSLLNYIDISTAHIDTSHRAGRLFQLIVDMKTDAYLDLLQVVAYHSSAARYGAISILVTFWPEAVGHVTASQPLPITLYKPQQSLDSGHPFEHQFVPWRFPAAIRRATNLFVGEVDHSQHFSCHACGESIHGFGLWCILCPCTVHFNCYDSPDGSFLSQYPLASDPDTHRVAVTRFSRIQPFRRGTRRSFPAGLSHHHFHLVSVDYSILWASNVNIK